MLLDTFTFSSRTANTTSVNHSLGARPRFVLILAKGATSANNDLNAYLSIMNTDNGSSTINASAMFIHNASRGQLVAGSAGGTTNITDSSLSANNSSATYAPGIEYLMITGV